MWEKWYQNNIHNNYHADSCTTGNVKLVGGNTTSEGVEYCYKDRYKIPQSHYIYSNWKDVTVHEIKGFYPEGLLVKKVHHRTPILQKGIIPKQISPDFQYTACRRYW